MSMAGTQVAIYIDEELLKKIDRIATRQSRTRSNLITVLLEDALKKVE